MNDSIMRELGRVILIGSGAIGTCLRRTGITGDEPVELLNLRQPETVRNMHAAYRSAGSQILVTNTFAANIIAFADADADELCEQVNRAGVALAREAGAPECLIWASVGPLGLGLRLDDYPDDALLDIYRSQCRTLADADALLLETFVNVREARAALQAAHETGLPVIFQIGNTGGGTQKWNRLDLLLAEAHRAGATAVGVNCHHPDEIVRAVSYLRTRTDLPLTASPNAGHPRIERGIVEYEFSPEEFASTVEALYAAGAAVIGGCCGTTPEHIRRIASKFSHLPVKPKPSFSIEPERTTTVKVKPDMTTNSIRSMMKSDRLIISVEIRADRRQSLSEIVQGAAKVAEAGADMFDVPDNPGATVGRDAMVTAARLQDNLRIPSICHFSVTQSNLMRLHSTLIGCWDSGLRGLLAVTGDAPSMGHLGHLVHRVMDMRSSVELLRLIRELREGKIINGESLADPPDFCSGCAIGKPITGQIRWLQSKIEAGAEFAFSQPVFTLDDYRRLRDTLADMPIRLFVGVMPLVSHRNAVFMAGGRIPGISVPAEIVSGFEKYHSPEDQRRFGIDRVIGLASEIAREAAGLYIIMPFGKSCYEDTAQIVRHVR